jgi:hypothetical protein
MDGLTAHKRRQPSPANAVERPCFDMATATNEIVGGWDWRPAVTG